MANERDPSITIGFYDGEDMVAFIGSVWRVADGLLDGTMMASEGATALFEALTTYELAGLGMNMPDAKEPERE